MTDDLAIDQKQNYQYVIKDLEFYDKHVYEWHPSSFFSTNNSNPVFNNPLDKKKFDKKFGGVAIEKEADQMIALAPKMYNIANDKNKKILLFILQ
jgi:hypothetical protein